MTIGVVDITEGRLAQQALEERLRFQKLAAGIATGFAGLSGDKFQQSIQDALAEIGRYFEVDAVRLYRLSPQGDVLKIRNTWMSEDLAPPNEMAAIHKLKYPNVAAHFSKGDTVVFGKYDDSPQWPEMREILKFLGIKAGIGVPLEIDGSGVDVFAMDKILSEHVWPNDILEHAKAIGQVILSAMRRREAEVELQALRDRLEEENLYLRKEVSLENPHSQIIGESKPIRKALQQVELVAETDSTVLLQGETGTGKELFAEAIHNLSARRGRTLVKVNCAALPDTLIESELFGREKGAYTGALTKQAGRFEIADKSTIFLDEIAELSPEVQAKLLRVLQEGQFERLGSSTSFRVDARIIAATNRDLKKAVDEGKFRQDLYYRLCVFPIDVPPLRERAEDIPKLTWHFVQMLNRKMGKRIEHISKRTMEAMLAYSWPGNVRELRNIIERALIISPLSQLVVELPRPIETNDSSSRSLEDVERQHIANVLERTRWRVRGAGGAADVLGLKPSTLEFRMKKLDIKRPT